MALTASGQLSLGDIATEMGASLADVSLTTQSTTDINTSSPSYPDGATPHAISEFYSYDHSAVGVSYTTLSIDGTNYYTINSDVITSGYQFDMIFASGSTDNIIYSYREDSTTAAYIGGLVIDTSGSVQSVGTPVSFVANAGPFSLSQVNSSGRNIVVYRNIGASGFVRARLFDYDTGTQTVTLVGSETNVYSGTSNNSVTDAKRISDTIIFAVSNRGGTGIRMHKITISGDTLSASTTLNNFQIGAGSSTTKFMKTGTDSGFVITQRRPTSSGVNRYIDYVAVTNLTGSPSYGTRTQLIDAGGQYISGTGAKYVGNEYGLISYSEDSTLSGDGKHHVASVSFSGTTLTYGSEITTTATSADALLDSSVHDIIIMETVGSLVYFVSKVAGVLAIFGTINISDGTLTKIQELSSFAPVDFFGSGDLINASSTGEGTNLFILGNNGTDLVALTGSIS